MKAANYVVWALIAQALLLPADASAEMIVDTGPATHLGGVVFALSNGMSGELQFLAGEFTTTQAYDITGLSAFVRQLDPDTSCPCSPMTSTFHLGLATGPTEPSAATFTDLLSLPVSFTSAADSFGWASVSVPDYRLPAGTYWIVASATSTDDPPVGMPGGVPNPLPAYANAFLSTDNWNLLFGLPKPDLPPTLGFQVEGEPVSTVPLPGALGLLASGLGLLTTFRRRVG
jgi:hypothetical protein